MKTVKDCLRDYLVATREMRNVDTLIEQAANKISLLEHEVEQLRIELRRHEREIERRIKFNEESE